MRAYSRYAASHSSFAYADEMLGPFRASIDAVKKLDEEEKEFKQREFEHKGERTRMKWLAGL